MDRPLAALAFAFALIAPAPPAAALTVTNFDVTSDQLTGTAHFRLTWDGTPDFFTLNFAGAQADSFQFYIYNNGPADYPLSFGDVLIRGAEIPFGGGVVTRFVSGFDPSSEAGGWGPKIGAVPFTLTANILEFAIPFALLNETDGIFDWGFEAFRFGATTQTTLNPVPIPAALPLFATGLGVLGLLRWRRKRKAIHAAA